MPLLTLCFRHHLLLVLLALVGIMSAPTAIAQEAATEEAAVADEPAAEAEEEEVGEVDPYKVPEEGGVDELVMYLLNGQRAMSPRTRVDFVRMHYSLSKAALLVYESDEASAAQKLLAARQTARYLGTLDQLREEGAAEELASFLDRVLASDSPELQSFARGYILDQKIRRFSQLEQAGRDEVIAEVKAGLQSEEISGTAVVSLMRLSDAVAETPDASTVVELITETLPKLGEDAADRAVRLEGLVRRLQLPGNKMELDGTLLDGEMVDWESYRGKVILVDFWATWCGPCIAELPNVIAAHKAYGEKGFDVLGISLDSNKEAVEKFVEAREIPWSTLYSNDEEANGWSHPMAVKYAINSIPRAILVDQEGKVVSMNLRGPALEKALAELLGPADPPAGDEASTEAGDETAKTAAVQQ